MRMIGARAARPSVRVRGDSSTAGLVRYDAVMPGVSLEYDVAGASLKERIVLASSQARREFTFMLEDPRHSLGEVSELPGGGFAFSNRTAAGMQISLVAPTAWSRGMQAMAVPGDGSAWQRVSRVRGGYRIRIGLGEGWARDAVYPVTLDPSLTYTWPEGTLATAFGRSWWGSPWEEEPYFTDCELPSFCPAMVAEGGAIFVADESIAWGEDEEDQPGYVGYVEANLSSIPWSTRIDKATLGFDALPATESSPYFPWLAVRPASAPLDAGDPIPRADAFGPFGKTEIERSSTFFEPGMHPTSEGADPTPTRIEADVTAAVSASIASGEADRTAFTVGNVVDPCMFYPYWCPDSFRQRAHAGDGGKEGDRNSASAGAARGGVAAVWGRGDQGQAVVARNSVMASDFADGPGARWLHNPSLVIEYSGAVLPPPLPVDQLFGCPCGEWGTGSDAAALDADPINTALGRSLEIIVDAPLSAPGEVVPWGRVYNGDDDTDGPLGVGWTHPYNASLEESTNPGTGTTTAVFRDPTGGRWRWTRAADGTYVAGTGVTASLEASSGGGWTVTSTAGRVITFDASGRQVSDHDRNGNGMSLGYSGGRLTTLTDTAGSTTTLSYGSTGSAEARIVEVQLPGGRTVGYEYDTSGGAVNLAGVEDPTGETSTYAYDGAGLLTGVTDPEGNTRAVNTYNDAGRVITQAEPTSTTEEPHEWTFDWQTPPGSPTDYPAGSGVQTTTDPDGVTTKQYYYGHVLFRSIDDAGGATDYTYDADANLVAITDPLGYVTTMTYDTRGNLLTLTGPAPESITETWTYNPDNQVTSHTNGAGETTTYGYAGGLQTSITDAEGGVTQHVFDTQERLVEITSPEGRTTEYDYDSAGNLASVTSPSGATVTYTHDAAGNVLTETTARGHTTTYTYDQAGRVLTATNPTGTVTTNTYDAAGRRTGTVTTSPSDEVLRETSTTYDPAGRVLTQSLFDRTVVTHAYTPAGRLSYSRDAEDRDTYYDYDRTGRQVGVSGPGPDTWTTYDAAGRLAEQYVNAITTTFTYDSAGRQISTITGDLTTETAYDDAGRPIEVTDPDGGLTVMAYDDNGRLVSQAAPGRQPTTFTYDDDGQRLSETSPSGLSTRTWTYTPDGQIATETSPRGNAPGAVAAHFTTSYDYDLDGNQTSRTDPLGRTWSTAYNNLGLPVEDEDPRGHTTGYAYDRLGQLTTVTAADDSETSYTYNQYGNRTSRTDARGNTTAYGYDSVGQLLTETDPLDRSQTYTYDWDGNLETHTNARGQTITYGYDWGTDRVTSRTYGNAEEYFSWDASARLASFTDSTGTTELGYNGRGLFTSVDQPGNDDFSYTYTPAGAVASRTYPSGATINYTHTPDGLTATQERAGRTTSYTWDRDQNLTQVTYPASVDKTETRVIDRAGRVSAIHTTHTSTTAPVLSLDYDRNEVGSPTSITRTRGTSTPTTEAFTYNDRDWLARWCPDTQTCTSSATDQVQYVYDAVGNQTSVVGAGEVPDPGTIAITYDNADQRTTTTRTSGTDPGTITHQWDADGNLTDHGRQYDPLGRLTTADASAGGAASYTYNALGHRRTITIGSDNTDWTWDINNPHPMLAESTETDDTTQVHDYTPEAWALSSTSTGTSLGGQWYSHDAQGSIHETFTELGDRAYSEAYDPWGASVGDVDVTSPLPPPSFGFTSATRDPGTGDWHLRARDYDPSWRGFGQVDPVLRNSQQPWLSPYTYVDNQPTTGVDPTGEFCRGCSPGSSVPGEGIKRPQPPIIVSLGGGGGTGRRTVGGTSPLGALAALCRALQSVAGTNDDEEDRRTLFHYTDEAGLKGILGSGHILPSLLINRPTDAKYGEGVYLTDIQPGTKTGAELSRAFLAVPWHPERYTHFVEIDVNGLDVYQGRPHIYVVRRITPLPILDRLVRFGRN